MLVVLRNFLKLEAEMIYRRLHLPQCSIPGEPKSSVHPLIHNHLVYPSLTILTASILPSTKSARPLNSADSIQ